MVFDNRYYRFHVKVSDSFLPFILLIISIPFLSSEHSFNRDNVFVIKKDSYFEIREIRETSEFNEPSSHFRRFVRLQTHFL